MNVYGRISGTLTPSGNIGGKLTSAASINGTLSVPFFILPPEYHGAVTVTPSADRQTLTTQDLYLTTDITIEPIPNNYGLITWDGSTLTVS